MKANIPPQETGGSSDTVSTIDFPTAEEAAQHFLTVKKRFLDVNNWGKYAGGEMADFSLYDSEGARVSREPKPGDFFRIAIPGPDNPTGNGDDWVRVEKIETEENDTEELVYIRVRPCTSPINPTEDTAHFFDEKATSNFIIHRNENKITAEVHGRNETPNTQNLNLLEKIRNTMVAIGGILLGSKIQWKSLTRGLIQNEK